RTPVLFAVAAVAAASMAGLPPLLGFVAKESVYEALLHGGGGVINVVALAGVALGSVLTFAYSVRFLHGAFADKRSKAARDAIGAQAARARASFVAPAALLAAFTLVVGALPEPLSPLVGAAGRALDSRVSPAVLHLWHGFGPPLYLSLATYAAALALVAARARVERLQARVRRLPGSHDAYRASISGLNRLADRLTGTVQSGSLPIYLSVILLTIVALPAPALLRPGLRAPAAFSENPAQLIVALGVLAASIGLLLATRRFAAVLFLGAIGYGVALLFVIQGAPDLALTQLLIETLGLVIFVLVLRHLPDRFATIDWRLGQTVRRAVAGAVGLFVFVFALAAGSVERPGPPVSEAFLAQSLSEAGGRNVVNVVLIDFRGIDTLGEITVLAVAALGIAGLVRASYGTPPPPPPPASEPELDEAAR
ncbi:MAG TPA: hydrogen gas-evolving membrane-bound hydrogenase subunit E, partial [Egibacteraceae bacterium]|nr:hydrogen gas-evolving membrane-bound hydrogenase subunit E [Egibacteraceae bacterium]